MKEPPNEFHFKGRYHMRCTKIHDDDFYILYMIKIHRKIGVFVQLVYLFRKESDMSTHICRQNKCVEKMKIVSTYLVAKTRPDIYTNWPLQPFREIGFNLEETFW